MIRPYLLYPLLLLAVSGCVYQPVVYQQETAYSTSTSDDSDHFYQDLAPWGEWVVHLDYGRVWRPRGLSTSWRPYTHGYWEPAGSDWRWHSDYPWGRIVFHYGRWFQDHRQGWLWVPGRQYADAWVSWRYDDDWVGWAPLPPKPSAHRRGHRWTPDYRHYHFVRQDLFSKREIARHIRQGSDRRDLYERTREVTRYPGPKARDPQWLRDQEREKQREIERGRGAFGGKPAPHKAPPQIPVKPLPPARLPAKKLPNQDVIERGRGAFGDKPAPHKAPPQLPVKPLAPARLPAEEHSNPGVSRQLPSQGKLPPGRQPAPKAGPQDVQPHSRKTPPPVSAPATPPLGKRIPADQRQPAAKTAPPSAPGQGEQIRTAPKSPAKQIPDYFNNEEPPQPTSSPEEGGQFYRQHFSPQKAGPKPE